MSFEASIMNMMKKSRFSVLFSVVRHDVRLDPHLKAYTTRTLRSLSREPERTNPRTIPWAATSRMSFGPFWDHFPRPQEQLAGVLKELFVRFDAFLTQ